MTKKKQKGRKGKSSPQNPVPSTTTDREAGPDGGGQGGERLWRAVLREPFALGLAVVVFFRPWRDGLTYSSFNTYFLGIIIVMAAFWGARLLLRGDPIRFRVPLALFAAYLLVALLTGFGTVQVDATYRSLLFWTGHFFLFLLCTNALRSRLGIGIVLGAFVVTCLGNALYSLVHFEYILPLMREQVQADPSLIREYFHTDQITPEIRRRLEVNRAFGTLLFPNALAAFLILGIPYMLGEAWPTLRAWRAALSAGGNPDEHWSEQPMEERMFVSAAVGVLGWFITSVLVFFCYPYLLLLVTRDPNWLDHTWKCIFYLLVTPLGVAALSLMVTRHYGLSFLRLSLQLAALGLTFAVQVVALWLTFSRGGAMALVLAMLVAGTLFALGASGRFRRSTAKAATAVLLLAAVLAVSLVPSSWAQDDARSQAPGPEVPVSRDGVDVGVTDLVSTSSLSLRLTYWKVGLIMAKANFWTGVGLGNFGTAYAKYQYLGAGGVQTAHNDYLQTLCETGIFGFLAFCGFWAYFCIWGARRILRETEAPNRWLLCGLYGGVLAFLLHSLVDFNFYNPALVSLVFFMAGLFYARAAALDSQNPDGGPDKPVVYRILALPVLLAVAFVITFSLRVYIYDYAQTEGSSWTRILSIGDRKPMRQRIQVAKYFLQDLARQPGTPNDRPYILLSEVARLINVRKTIEEFGAIWVPVGDPPSLRPLAKGQVPPPETVVFIQDAERARQTAAEMSESFLEQIKLANEIYPHSPEDAMVLFEWYDLLQGQATDPGQKRKYVMECERWAEAGVRRNPEQAWFHQWYGKALMMRGNLEGGSSGTDYFFRAVAEYQRAIDLYPISPHTWSQYATVLSKLGNAFVRAGRVDEGEKMIADGKKSQARADELVALTS